MPSTLPRPRAVRRIALIGFDGVQALDLIGPMEVFAKANAHRPSPQPRYDLLLASPRGGEIVSNAGARLSGARALDALPDGLDTILVAGGSEAGLRAAIFGTELLPWLQQRAASTRRLASVCTGAFVLAAAGLLDGRRATTHWSACSLLQELRPAIRVDPDAIFVAEPPLYTSAGVTAGIDLCLALVEDDCGPATALAVARDLVLFLRRPGGQSQFSAGLRAQAAASPRLRTLVAEIAADPSGDLRGAALAARAGMSERTFARAFRKETGTTPAQFVKEARVERARMLLETTAWPLARIAERSGFRSVDSLHRRFLDRVGVTPAAYRERFGAVDRRSAERGYSGLDAVRNNM